MAHKKGLGSSKNGRDSNAQRLGVKSVRRRAGDRRVDPGPAARHAVQARRERRARQGRYPVRQSSRHRRVPRSRAPGKIHQHRTGGLDRLRTAASSFLPSPMFIDEVRIRVKAGDGGNGCLAFRREKYVPRGGPSGGDGGRGGDVILVASEHQNTLLHLRFNPEHTAERGRHGEGSNRTGREGASIEVPVPVGTVVYDADTGELLHDFTESRRALSDRARRSRRARQPALRHSHAPGAHRARTGTPGRRAAPAARAEAAGRRRTGRIPERRKIHADLAHLGRAAQDRRLSVHHARTEPRRGQRRRLHVRGRRHSRPDRRARTWATVWAPSFCGTSNARGCWCTWWMFRSERPRAGGGLPHRARRAVELQPGAGGQADVRGGVEDGCGAGSRARVAALRAAARKMGLPFYEISSVTGEGIEDLKIRHGSISRHACRRGS